MQRLTRYLLLLVLAIPAWPRQGPAIEGEQAGAALVAEGQDFATQVLRDPWDMASLSDVSLYLNRSGQSYDTQSIQISNGVFSAQSTGTADTNFSVLFPGIEGAIKAGKVGALHPITSAAYQCLYVAMQVEGGDSYAQVMWFENDQLNTGTWGVGEALLTTDSRWTVYFWDLSQAPGYGTGWAGRPAWQGLRIDPSNQANRNYAVDWVRLTDCDPVNHTVTWTPNGGVNAVWVQPQGTSRAILAKASVNGISGSTQLDVQGLEPGTYTVRLGTSAGCCALNANNGDLTVNQAPIAKFVAPSFISGADYASQAGNTWDFADGADLVQSSGASANIGGGQLELNTPSGPPPGGTDAQVWLNSPFDLSGGDYRYLVFRLSTEWIAPWPNAPQGMIGRWIWSIPGVSGQPANRCYLVSHDIPLDLGWQTYVIDLHDTFNGVPEDTSVIDCPGQPAAWANTGAILDLRFDPNENITEDSDPITGGGPFHQRIDWFRLTAPDRVSSGTPYLVQIELNQPGSAVDSVNYYYTINRDNPTQSAAQRWTPGPPLGPYEVFVPLLSRGAGAVGGADTLPQADLSFWWDTGGVTANTYYLCAVISINPNTATYCSAAPIVVQ